MIRARRRSIYCSPAEWAEISERARSADMRKSPFVIACALAEDEEEKPDTGPHDLVPGPQRQRPWISQSERLRAALPEGANVRVSPRRSSRTPSSPVPATVQPWPSRRP